MPYVIVSTVALLSNLYKNAPLIVGDKDSDIELMRYLGARMTTNYPTCNSPPMYVLHAPPRVVFDNLEKRGYTLLTAQTIQEHSVWVLARPRLPEDDKVEIEKGGPNDKAVQTVQDSTKDSSSPSTVKEEKKVELKKIPSNRGEDKLGKQGSTTVNSVLVTGSAGFIDDDVRSFSLNSFKSGDFFGAPLSGSELRLVRSQDDFVGKSHPEQRPRQEASFHIDRTSFGDSTLLNGKTQACRGDTLCIDIPALPEIIVKYDSGKCPPPPPPPFDESTEAQYTSGIDEDFDIRKMADEAMLRCLPQLLSKKALAAFTDQPCLSCVAVCETCCCEE